MRKINFHVIKNCLEVNNKNNFWNLREHHRKKMAVLGNFFFQSTTPLHTSNYLIAESFMKFPFIQLLFCNALWFSFICFNISTSKHAKICVSIVRYLIILNVKVFLLGSHSLFPSDLSFSLIYLLPLHPHP